MQLVSGQVNLKTYNLPAESHVVLQREHVEAVLGARSWTTTSKFFHSVKRPVYKKKRPCVDEDLRQLHEQCRIVD